MQMPHRISENDKNFPRLLHPIASAQW